ncbi:MAG: prolyl oligopeptidase family serine peptidase [Betaproteobacteria bacterium]
MLKLPSISRTCICVAVLLGIPLTAFAQDKPPAAPIGETTDVYFGKTVADPYRSLEDLKDPQVAAWMKAQAGYTRAVLDRIPQRDKLLDEIARYADAASARVSSVQVSGDSIYYLKRRASENIPKLYVRRGVKGAERLLVDPDALPAPEGKHNAIDYYAPSPDNRLLAFGLSPGGSEESVLHVIDVATGKQTADVIDRANYAQPSFPAASTMIYSRLQKMPPGAPVTDKYRNQRVFLHKLGDDPDKDIAVLGAGLSPRVPVDSAELVFAGVPRGSDYLVGIIANGVQNEIRVYVAPKAALGSADIPWVKVADSSDDVTDVAVHGNTAYLLSHKDASRFKLLKAALADPDIAKAEVVIAPGESVITGTAAAKDALYVRKMNGGVSELVRLAYTPGAKAEPIKLPFEGDIDSLAADPQVAGVLFDAGAWTRFGGLFAYNPTTRKVVDTGLQPQGRYDNPKDLVSREVKVKAADGTLIPMSIVHRKGIKLDGSNPTILYGYGAYGISMTPFFRPDYLPWFNRGGVFAVAHVRGGGEFGEDWHKAGYKSTKSNTWNDAIACAEWLIANKYATPSRLAIQGGSAGGIFVGRSITERPDLFAAALDQVPVSDSLRMEFSSNGVPNIPEFGSVKTEEGFKALLEMSAYHHVKDGTKYPAVLVETGFNDPRVDAWEAGKMAARLQAATTSGKPILLRIDYDAGHGFGSTKKQRYAERADNFAFLFWQFGVKGFQP